MYYWKMGLHFSKVKKIKSNYNKGKLPLTPNQPNSYQFLEKTRYEIALLLFQLELDTIRLTNLIVSVSPKKKI